MNSPRGVAAIALVLMVLLAGAAVDRWDRDHHLGSGALVTDGEVTAVHEGFGRGDSSYVTVNFTTADGRHVHTDVEDYDWRPKPHVGDSARIRYNPADPGWYVRDDRLGPDRITLALLTLGTAACLLVTIAGVRNKLPRWLTT